MAHVLSISKVGDISNYIREQVFNKPANFERSGFLSFLDRNANFKNWKELMEAVKRLFNDYATGDHIFKIYKKYAHTSDIPFLE